MWSDYGYVERFSDDPAYNERLKEAARMRQIRYHVKRVSGMREDARMAELTEQRITVDDLTRIGEHRVAEALAAYQAAQEFIASNQVDVALQPHEEALFAWANTWWREHREAR